MCVGVPEVSRHEPIGCLDDPALGGVAIGVERGAVVKLGDETLQFPYSDYCKSTFHFDKANRTNAGAATTAWD